jgi:hypothetical protein
MKSENLWPPLPFEEWQDTLEALHMKMQVVGKIKLALNPFLNQWWQVAFYLNASGMTTGLIPYNNIIFEINFDFINHNLFIRTSDNRTKTISLIHCTVAEFYKELMDTLDALDINVTINTLPSEVPNPVHCYEDMRIAYDKEYVFRWWQIQIQCGKVLERFRSGFNGKSSPVHFYWGSFDLNETRYSGKPAAPPEGGGKIMQFAENEENFSCGFWPGNENYPKPAFYSYMYPAPAGIESVRIKPKEAAYSTQLREFILDYGDVRKSHSPDELILEFLNTTYEEGAKLAGWNIESLKTQIPE